MIINGSLLLKLRHDTFSNLMTVMSKCYNDKQDFQVVCGTLQKVFKYFNKMPTLVALSNLTTFLECSQNDLCYQGQSC